MAKEKKEFEISLQKLQKQISALRKAIIGLKATGLNESVLYHALQKCANKHYTQRYCKQIGIPMIRAIVEGIGDLEDYIFPPEETE